MFFRHYQFRGQGRAESQYRGFGTVFGVVDGKSLPVCDYAGFAPFGFGYRRCPGKQLTVNVFEDFPRKVWRDKIVFRRLNAPSPGEVPIGPNAVILDDLGFTRSAQSISEGVFLLGRAACHSLTSRQHVR